MRYIYIPNDDPQVDKEVVANTMWLENCINCHVRMYPVLKDARDILVALVRSIRWRPLPTTDEFEAWYTKPNPRIEGISEIWHCKECNELWAPTFGMFCVVNVYNDIEGMLVQTTEIAEALVPSYIYRPVPLVIDRQKPFEDAIMCSECHKWRQVTHTDIILKEGISYEIKRHTCPQCHSVEVVTSEQKQIMENQFIKRDIDPADLVGAGDEISIAAIMKKIT